MRPERLQRAYAKAIDELDAADKKLSRALSKWQRARRRARRYELELEKLFAATRPSDG